MITMIVPTRNRAYTLSRVLPSYFGQAGVTEIILVDDAGSDDTAAVLAKTNLEFPQVASRVIKNAERKGASYSRQAGAAAAANPYVLFCDDDEYLEDGYAATCLEILKARNAGAVSGRRVYMRKGETPAQALARFGHGVRNLPPFDNALLELNNAARFTGTVSVPFANAIILTPRDLVQSVGFDEFYARGNGYREESDYQINLFLNGHDILMTDDAHSIHLPLEEVRQGGQRTNVLRKLAWSIYYNNYFFDKYYVRCRSKTGVTRPLWFAKAANAVFITWRLMLRPAVYPIVTALLYRKQAR